MRFKGVVLDCVICGASFKAPPSRAETAKACSHACAVKVRAQSRMRRITINCRWCGKPFEVPRCHASRRVYCSRVCMETAPGWRDGRTKSGSANPAWKGGVYRRRDGYVYEIAFGHPFAAKKSGHVLQHRLVVERWLRENDPASPFLIEVGGKKYLSRAYHVHHRDEDRTNNSIENLQCMTPEEHRAHHRAFTQKALKFYRQHLLDKEN